MTERSDRGVAYDFWVRVKTEQASRGWTDSELHRRSGISRNTIAGLKTRTRVEAGTINALAAALDIPQRDAHQLAGLVPAAEQPSQASAAREAILNDPLYNDEQRAAMLQLLDIFDKANRARQD